MKREEEGGYIGKPLCYYQISGGGAGKIRFDRPYEDFAYLGGGGGRRIKFWGGKREKKGMINDYNVYGMRLKLKKKKSAETNYVM